MKRIHVPAVVFRREKGAMKMQWTTRETLVTKDANYKRRWKVSINIDSKILIKNLKLLID